MDYIIAVRSYKRSHLFPKMTYSMLEANNLLDRLYVFVANEEEAELYTASLQDAVPVIVGALGGAEATSAIIDYFPAGKRIAFLDDDLKSFYYFDEEKNLNRNATNLGAFLQEGFDLLDTYKVTVFTFSFGTNKMFLKGKPRWELRPYHITGGFFCARNSEILKVPAGNGHNDDCIRTANFLSKNNCILLFWWAGFTTVLRKQEGGLQALGRESMQETTLEQWESFPLLQRYYIFPKMDKNGLFRPKLKTLPQLRKIFAEEGRHLGYESSAIRQSKG